MAGTKSAAPACLLSSALMLLFVSHTTIKQINIIFQVRLPSSESGPTLVLCSEPSLLGWVCGEIILLMARQLQPHCSPTR